MRNRRPSPEHEQAVARRLALLAAEWDTAKAADAQDALVPAGGEWPWNPPTRVAGSSAVELPSAQIEVVEAMDLAAAELDATVDEVAETEVAEAELPPLVRAPGRHAARRGPRGQGRGGPAVPGWFISPMAGARARLTSAHLTWVAVLVAVALGTTCWWLLEAKESTVLTPVSASFTGAESGVSPEAADSDGPTTAPDGESTPTGATGETSTSGASGGTGASGASGGVEEVVVDVAGKVRRPGIVVLPAGSRVVDAVEAAGGARRGVDLTSLNLARRLLDGEQILVGRSAAAGVGAAPAPGSPSSPVGALVNLNSAGQTELETLPGVGPVTAAAIVEWRERHGGFTAVEDLLEVDGIGEVTLKRLAPLVSV